MERPAAMDARGDGSHTGWALRDMRLKHMIWGHVHVPCTLGARGKQRAGFGSGTPHKAQPHEARLRRRGHTDSENRAGRGTTGAIRGHSRTAHGGPGGARRRAGEIAVMSGALSRTFRHWRV
eukprot:7381006-Prymnesium_polylepis.1